ncbi:carbohydrate ABC transporter permease [Acetatifactor muris]|uniref:Lactose transport system permease protein LacG n=1 Tax=Acetatifactor muris TaxID=879566 RepID=A0A2K4ZHD5_9FIRM|nr:carbohydrate ABC transporter permease [Acetatifactor muris]MCR2048048.1 carbohydrate ABC transporter permease [Acetatifactor muris]SOY29877.1 Lactose transport system permease protein LacG [Acetatifactor muris]
MAAKTAGKKKKFSIGMAVIYVLITLLAFACLYPFLNVLACSLSGYNPVLSGKVTFYPIDFTIEAYKQILGRTTIWTAMRTTVLITLLGTALSLVLTILAAYGLSIQDLPGRRVMTGFILFTMYFGGGMIPTFLVVKGVGLYNTLGALFIPQSISVFNFIVMRTFFRELPDSLQDAARIDGASYMQVLFKIVLPLSLAVIATIGLFYAVGYWNSYFDALIYIQDGDKYTLQLRLRNMLFGSELGNAADDVGGTVVMPQSLKMATVAVSTIPILIVYPWLQKYFVKGVMLGSVKG